MQLLNRLRPRLASLVFFSLVIGANSAVVGNPAGGSVVGGSATIQTNPGSVLVKQTSSAAIINWQSFSINSGETTRFFQPSSQSAALNRVLGGGVSQINGTLFANGQVYIINQNGILVGPGGEVNTAGGFTASTRDISNQDFLRGKDSFVGHSHSGVKNLGGITSTLGNVVLIGKTLRNNGKISASHGAVELVAGDNVLLGQNLGGNTITVDPSHLAKMDPERIGVDNTGQITAAAAHLKAANGNIYALAINNGGVIRTSTVNRSGGHIWLTSRSGSIVNSGLLNASAAKSGGNGGTVFLKDPGTVSDSGALLARGGRHGSGGRADISGGKLNFTGSVNLTAASGHLGSLLIDPATLNVITTGTGVIVSGQNDSVSTTISPTTIQTSLMTEDVTLNADSGITITNAITSMGTSTILTLSTNDSGSTISINAPITVGALEIDTKGASDVITPNSSGSINVNLFILQSGFWDQNALGGTLPSFLATYFTVSGTSEFLRFQNGNGTSGNPYMVTDIYGFQGIGSPNSALVGTSSVPVYYKQANSFSTYTGNWNSSAGFTTIGSQTNPFYGTYDGNGYTIGNLTANSSSATYFGIFGEVGTATFKNIGLVGGSITGQSYVGGLVGIGAVNITNCYTTGSVSGSGIDVGGLVGLADSGSSITSSYNSGSVGGAGSNTLGGLVGKNYGTITSCYNTGTIATTGSSSEIGGLVGENDGSVMSSYSTGNVSGSNDVGGLAGNTSSPISLSYATGTVTGASACGGLVGQTSSSSSYIYECYATGSTTATSGLGGGLVGYNNGGMVQTSYSSGSVSGGAMLGGFIGSDVNGTIKDDYYSSDGSGQALGIGVISGTSITYNGAMAENVTGNTSAQLAIQSNFDSAWSFTPGSGTWGINGYSTGGYQINSGRPFLQNQFTGVASVTPSAQPTTYNRTSMGTGFSTTAYTTTGSLSEIVAPVLTLTGSNENVGTTNNLTISSVSPSPGYAIEIPPVTALETFSAKAITISGISPAGSTYGTTPAFSDDASSQVISGDTLGGTTTYSTTDATSPAGYLNVGAYNFTPSISGYNSNYTITGYNSASFGVNPKPITVSATSIAAVTYGNTPAFSNDNGGGGVFTNDSLGGTVSYSNTLGSSSAGFINAGTGSYTPSISGANSNYSISYASSSFTINPKALTVSGNNISSVYGTAPAYSNNGESLVYSGDTLGGTATYSSTDGTSPAGFPNAGSYSYTPSISGQNANYTISGYNSGMQVVTPKPITVSASAIGSTTYGSTPSFANDGESQVLSGDTLGGTSSYSSTGTLSPAGFINVGSYNYTPSLSGYNANYTISTYNSAPFSVVPLPIIVSANVGLTSTYGSAPAFSHNGETQVLSGDTLGGTTTFSNTDALSSAGYLNAGTYSYTPTITAYNPNYSISAYNDASFTVNPKPLTVSGANTSAVYGTTPAYSNDGESLVFSGDTLGGTASYTSTAATSPAGFQNAGSYSYTPSLIGYNPNYSITAYNSANLTITPKAIIVSATPISSNVYGSTPSFGNDGESQVFSGDTLGGTVAYANTGTLSPAGFVNVGTYTYSPLISGYNPNYTITRYNSAPFTEVPLSIVVSANAGLTATYGNTPLFAQNGETQVLPGDTLGGTATFTNTDALSTAGYLNSGTYSYTPHLIGSNANYSIGSYNSASFTINPLPITVSARPFSATYGSSPVFSDDGNSQVLTGDFLGGSTSYSNNDLLSSGGYFNAGTYTYSPSVTGANPNYSVTTAPARFTINPAALMVSVPTGQSVVYGTASSSGNASFTYSESGLLPGDSLPISLGGYSLGQTVNGGPYAISAAAGANSNYTLVLNGANFNVTPKPISVSATDLTASPVTYGNAVPFSNDGAAGQLVGTDTLGGTAIYRTSDTLSPANVLNSVVYSYALSITGANPNYSLSFKPGSFAIDPKPIAITPNPGQSIVYGTGTVTGNASLTYTTSGLLQGDVLSGVLGGYSSSQNVGGGPYKITLGSLSNPNYILDPFTPSTFQISPATLFYVSNPAQGVLGLPFPQFSGTVEGFVNGDSLTNSTSGLLKFETTATSTSTLGLYPINGSGLNADNYTFAQAPGNAHAFSLTIPAVIVTFETSSSTTNLSANAQSGSDIGNLSNFGGDFLEGVRRERDRNNTQQPQTQTDSTNDSDQPNLTAITEDQNGRPINGFSIRGGVSSFDRQALALIPRIVYARLRHALSLDVRSLLAEVANSANPKSSNATETTVESKTSMEFITDKNGKPTLNFYILPGGTFGMGAAPVPPFVQQRIDHELDEDVRSALAKTR